MYDARTDSITRHFKTAEWRMRFPLFPPLPAFLETKACTLRFWCSLAELFELSVTNARQVAQRPYEYMLDVWALRSLSATVQIMAVLNAACVCFVL
jgi:hypothetical protein